MPDTAAFKNAEEAKSAITTAESFGKSLAADATSEETKAANEQAALAKAETMKTDYFTGMDNFGKKEVAPYKLDLDNYTATGTKFLDLSAKYKKGVLANNALAAKDRKASTVAALNKDKLKIDSLGGQLSKWKVKLDAAKAKLDVKSNALQKQQHTYETAEQTETAKLKNSKMTLNGLLNQMTICANYASKCHEWLTSKFKLTASPDTSYFISPAYRKAATDLYGYLVKLKSY